MEFTYIGPNYILKNDEIFLSYNPRTGIDNPLGELCSLLTGFENGKAETALRLNSIWYILDGDFRTEYLEAFPKGKEACLEVYKKNIQHRSDWSTDAPMLNLSKTH